MANKLIIDWELALQQANGNEKLAKQMMQMLLEALPAHESLIDNAYQKKDIGQLRNEVHKLYGALCYCGAPGLKKAAKDLEMMTATANQKELGELYHRLKAEMNALREEAKSLD